jgi:hypothetical protein
MSFHPEYKNKKEEQIDLQVLVFTRPNLRGSETEMLMYMGKTHLDNIFDKCQVDEKTTSLHFEYPERWTNIIEQRALLERIPLLYPNIKKVTIKTHSVYIIQCTHSKQVGICDDASKYPEKDYKDLSIRYCPLPSETKGLYVM